MSIALYVGNTYLKKRTSMKMQKRQFRIGQLAKKLAVEKFVIRFWEKEFDMSTSRSNGGQRFYDETDLEKFIIIKDLLYNKGYTINGAKQQLKNKNGKSTNAEQRIVASSKITTESTDAASKEISAQIIALQKKLIKLRELL